MLVLAGCGPKPPHERPPAAPSSPAAAAPTSGPHNWLYRVGQDYAYQGDASVGKGAPAIQIYRYLGVRDGLYTLQVNGETATCANPCQVITLHTGAFHIERVEFDEDSLIGAAFTDAFAGQLQPYRGQ